MIVLSWNCRGLGHPSAVPSLRDLVRIHKPDVIFLCETLCHANKIDEVRRIVGYESCFAIDREGRSRGLALLWKHSRLCEIQNYSRNFINVIMKEDGTNDEWRLTGFYGIPQRGQHRESWNILRLLAQQSTLPWCVIGDFNDILSTDDKRGRVPHPQWLLSGFQEAVSDCGLIDMPLQGHNYTWSRRLGSEHVVEERLDRALVSGSWMSMFPQCLLQNLVNGASNHSPILLSTQMQVYEYKKRQFRFENSWLVEPELNMVVTDGWSRGEGDPLLTRLLHCTEELDQWGCSLRKRYKDEIQKCKKRIEVLQVLENIEADGEVVMLKERLNLLLIQEETFWKQRAKTF